MVLPDFYSRYYALKDELGQKAFIKILKKVFIKIGQKLFIKFKNTKKMGKYWTEVIEQRGNRIYNKDYDSLSEQNKMPYEKLKKSWASNGRVDVNLGYTCGLNALNMANKMLGYSHQWNSSTYPYTYIVNPLLFIPGVNFFAAFFVQPLIKWGLHSEEFAKKLITPYYNSSNWKTGDTIPWDIIDNTNFQQEVVIVLVQWDLILHYILLIGVDDEKKWYITTDQSQMLHWIHHSTLKDLMKISVPKVSNYCAYRVGR